MPQATGVVTLRASNTFESKALVTMHPGSGINQGGGMGGFPGQHPPPNMHAHQQQMQMQAQMAAMQQGAPMAMHGGSGMMPLGPAAMPAQQHSQSQVFEFLPGVASLVEDLDKRVLVTLRDGRHFVGEQAEAS